MKSKTILKIGAYCLGFFTSCLHTHVRRHAAAGDNLGFEISEHGLPTNWIIYEPSYCPHAVVLDTVHPHEGHQCLRFDISPCSQTDRVDYTGFTNEFMELTTGGGRYRVSFWMKNSGPHFRIYLNEVSAKTAGEKPIIIESAETISDWKRFEAEVTIQPEKWLRFELQVKGEGSCWVDDVVIERIEGR